MIPPHWENNLEKARAARECLRLDHGWDESKSIYELTDEEIQTAAEFRGGKFLGLAKKEEASIDNSTAGAQNDDATSTQSGTKSFRKPCAQYLWECEHGHSFTASLEYVLLGGGWCDQCPLDNLTETTTPKNKFISQLL